MIQTQYNLGEPQMRYGTLVVRKHELEKILQQLYEEFGIQGNPHVGNRALLFRSGNLVGWIDFYYTKNGSYAVIYLPPQIIKSILH